MPKRLDPFLKTSAAEACRLRCGSDHSAILTSSGQVFTWGSNKHGQLGIQTEPRSHCGQPVCLNLSSKCLPVIDLALGSEHTLLLTSTHQILSFGQNAQGQLGLGKHSSTASTSSPAHIAEL